MVATRKLALKLVNQTIKRAELETLLDRYGFRRFGGKGSHDVWGHPDFDDVHIVIATHRKEVPSYQLRQIEKSLRKRGVL